MTDEVVRQIGEKVLQRIGFSPTELLYQRMGRVLHQRMRQGGFASIEAYAAHFARAGDAELNQLAEELAINETYFFREQKHFTALQQLLPELSRPGIPVRLLSAGCSSGEEAYSLAITAHRTLSPMGRRFSVLGVDIDSAALARAREGLYPAWSFREDGLRLAEGFVRPEGNKHRIREHIRQTVEFQQLNLVEEMPEGPFDVIFSRNMLMYLTPENRQSTIKRLTELLRDDGALFIGSAETLDQLPDDLERVSAHGTSYYRRRRTPREETPTAATQIRVLLLSRSPVFRVTVRQMVRSEPGITIAAEAATYPETRSPAERTADVILVDAATFVAESRSRGGKSPFTVPAVVVARPHESVGETRLGVDVVVVPATGPAGLREHAPVVLSRLRTAARRTRRLRGTGSLRGTGPLSLRRLPENTPGPQRPLRGLGEKPSEPDPPFERLLLIGCSTGGPAAVSSLVQALPTGLGLGVLIVQHMPAGFTKTFADRLDRLTAYRVIEGRPGLFLLADTIYVAPGSQHTLVGPRGGLRVIPPEPGDIYVPNVDRTFLSVARSGLANRTFAVVLTGMGDDGAEGMAALMAAGSETMVQHPGEAVVAGMVNATLARGAARRVMRIAEMPEVITRWAKGAAPLRR